MRSIPLVAVALLVPLANAQSRVSVDESRLRAELRNNSTVIVSPLENKTSAEIRGNLSLEWLNTSDITIGSAQRDITIRPGQSAVEIPLPIPDPSVWLRLRYSLTPDRTDERAFPPQSGILAISQIAKHAFELKVSHIGSARPGHLLTIHAQAIHPATRLTVPGVTFDATLTIADAAVLPEKTVAQPGGPVDFTFRIPDTAAQEPDDDATVLVRARRGDYAVDVEDSIRLQVRSSARLQTDKPIYQPGQTIHLRAVVFDGLNRALPNANVTLWIDDDENEHSHIAHLVTSRFGIAQDDWTLPAAASAGTYQITLKDGDEDETLATHAVRVSRYELPEFNVTAQPDRPAFMPQENAGIRVTGTYLFGKPVPNGRVKITHESEPQWNDKARKYETSTETVSEGLAGTDGVFIAHIDLSAAHASLKDNDAKFKDVSYAAFYTDPASGRTEQRRFDVRVTREPIHVYISSSSLAFKGTAPVYVSTDYASGKPAVTTVKVRFQGNSQTVKTNQYGIGKIVFPFEPGRDAEVVASATDNAGLTGVSKERYYAEGRAVARLETSHTIHRVGEPVALSVSMPSPSIDQIMIQAVPSTEAGDDPLAPRLVKLVNGRADVTFPFQPEFRRTVVFIVWNAAADADLGGQGILASKAVIFPDSSDLHVTAASARQTYRPGQKASIKMQARSSDGHPVEAAFGLAVVDQAVLERARTDREFGQRPWFSCAFCGSRNENEIGGVRINDLYALKPSAKISPDLDLVAELLVADSTSIVSTESSDSLSEQPPFRELKDLTGVFKRLLDRHFAETSEFPADKSALTRILGQQWTELRDPWGLPYQARFEIRNTSNVITLTSAGPDKRPSTKDDFEAASIRHSWFDDVRVRIAQTFKTQPDYPAAPAEIQEILKTSGIRPESLRDPWGTQFSFRVTTAGPRREIAAWSAGPDRITGTEDDIFLATFSGVYFQRERAELTHALQAVAELPRTLEEFRADIEKAGIDPASYRDAWGRPYRVTAFLSSHYSDRLDETVVRILGGEENRYSKSMPVTRSLITFSVRSAGPDGIEDTWDDFDIASFPTVLSEDPGNIASAPLARVTVPVNGTGVVTGVITDPAGAVISHATVSLIDANSVAHDTFTDSAGVYQFSFVPAGVYSLRVFSVGFRTYEVRQIPVTADKAVVVDATLQLGSVAESITVSAEAAQVQTETSEVSSSRLATPRVRDYFPETLLWLPEILTDKRGNAETHFAMADSVTNWKLAVVASTLDGRIADAESNIRTFQPFFLDFNPPPVLTVGDALDLPVTVRNYTNRNRNESVHLAPNAWSSVHGLTSKTVLVSAGNSANTTFSIKAEAPTESATERMISGVGTNGDAIEKKLRVHPDGREVTQTVGDVIADKTEFRIPIPPAAIAGATRGEIRIYPNVASMLFESAEGVLQTPHGCAEQTVSAGYANLIALRFARINGISSAALEKKAILNIDLARNEIPLFESADGGVRYWRTNNDPDIGVTAYALSFLLDAAPIVSVDQDEIESLVHWLEKQRNPDGRWSSKTVKTNVTDRQSILLTGLVIRALAAAQKSGIAIPAKIFAAAYHHVALFTDEIDEPYLLSQFILAAIDSGDEKLLGKATDRLIGLARQEKDGLYWDLQTNSPFYGWGTAGRYETTGLVVSALAASKTSHPEANEAESAMRKGLLFLLRGRDRFGSWQSTQSTVRAMRAMADAAPVLGNLGGSGGSIDILANGTLVRKVQLPSDPHTAEPILVDVSSVLQPGYTQLQLIPAPGMRSALVHVSSEYWIPWTQTQPRNSPDLRLSVKFDRLQAAIGDPIHCVVKAERAGFRGYGMMLAEVGLPPGVEVDRSSLESLVNDYSLGINRYDVLPDRVVFYLWPEAGGSTFDFVVRPRISMTSKSAPSVLYDYYNPEALAEVPPFGWVIGPSGATVRPDLQ